MDFKVSTSKLRRHKANTDGLKKKKNIKNKYFLKIQNRSSETYVRNQLTFAFEKISRQLQAFSWASSLSRLSISFLYDEKNKIFTY